MSADGRSVSVIAVDGGYIVEWNDLIPIPTDIGIKNGEGKSIQIPQYKTGRGNVAVRANVEEAMKFMGSLLLKRMVIKQEEAETHEMLSAYLLKKNDIGMTEKGPMATAEGPSYAKA